MESKSSDIGKYIIFLIVLGFLNRSINDILYEYLRISILSNSSRFGSNFFNRVEIFNLANITYRLLWVIILLYISYLFVQKYSFPIEFQGRQKMLKLLLLMILSFAIGSTSIFVVLSLVGEFSGYVRANELYNQYYYFFGLYNSHGLKSAILFERLSYKFILTQFVWGVYYAIFPILFIFLVRILQVARYGENQNADLYPKNDRSDRSDVN